MNLARRRRAPLLPSKEDDEEAPEGKSFRPLLRETEVKRVKEERGSRSPKSLHFTAKLCIAFVAAVVVIGALFFTLVTPNDTDTAQHQSVNMARQADAAVVSPSTKQAEAAVIIPSTTSLPPTPRPPTGTSPPKEDIDACSCLNRTAPSRCCERTIYRAHKFGTILVDTLFDSFRRSRLKMNVKRFPKQEIENYTLPTTTDYRHVIVTRNWFDAIVSGYLYHKAGYECWMNARGEKKRIVRTDEWDSHLGFHERDHIPFPPRNNRSICSCLAQESEEDGMRILMDLAVSKFYKGVVPYWNMVQEKRDGQQHSLFVCYEELVDPFQQERIYHQILDWLFPAGEARNMSLSADLKASLEQQQHNQTVYSGGHATEHDPELRSRLRTLVERHDRELFNNTVATSNGIFGCGRIATET